MKAAALGRRLLIGPAMRLVRTVLRSPRLKFAARGVLAHFPALRVRLQDWMYRQAMSPHMRSSNRPQGDADLSPRTLRMLRALDAEARRNPP